MKITQILSGATSLGKEIKISPKSAVLINKENFNVEFEEGSVMVKIKIGEEEGILAMSQKAFDKLKTSKVSCQTLRDFQKTFLK